MEGLAPLHSPGFWLSPELLPQTSSLETSPMHWTKWEEYTIFKKKKKEKKKGVVVLRGQGHSHLGSQPSVVFVFLQAPPASSLALQVRAGPNCQEGQEVGW